ncbi:MAG: hypothetical protein ACTSRW_02885 [Candidatus Helarchaeota archaeon]
MIITISKPLDTVKETLKSYKNIFILGCGDCCATCRTGGTEEVKAMIDKLKDDFNITGSIVVEAPCDGRVAKRDLRRVKDQIEKADAILAMTCGLGVQSVALLTKETVIPANNTWGMGIIEGLGTARQVCISCDECVLVENDGKCPVIIKQVCNDCGRILAWDAKCCDQCASKNLGKKQDVPATHKIL